MTRSVASWAMFLATRAVGLVLDTLALAAAYWCAVALRFDFRAGDGAVSPSPSPPWLLRISWRLSHAGATVFPGGAYRCASSLATFSPR